MSDIRTVSIWIVMNTVKDFARESKKPHESRIYKDSWGF